MCPAQPGDLRHRVEQIWHVPCPYRGLKQITDNFLNLLGADLSKWHTSLLRTSSEQQLAFSVLFLHILHLPQS